MLGFKTAEAEVLNQIPGAQGRSQRSQCSQRSGWDPKKAEDLTQSTQLALLFLLRSQVVKNHIEKPPEFSETGLSSLDLVQPIFLTRASNS